MIVAESETCKTATFVGQCRLWWPDPVSTEVGYSPEGLSDLLLSIVSDEKWEGPVRGVHLPSDLEKKCARCSVGPLCNLRQLFYSHCAWSLP